MNKLNWRDASKELPKLNSDGVSKLCIVTISLIKSNLKNKYHIDMDSYDPNKRLTEDGNLYLGGWTNFDNDVTHWIYADELPLPGDK